MHHEYTTSAPQRRSSGARTKKIDLEPSDTFHAKNGARRGRPPVPTETILIAVLFRLREGCSWRALSIFAPYTTIYTRWRMWCRQGLWDLILECIATEAKGQLWAIDSTSVKVHKHGFGSPQRLGCQGIGRSRGGANTKVHALVDTYGRAVRISLTPGNHSDITSAPGLVNGITERTILADKAYDSDGFRKMLDSANLRACIPAKANRRFPASYHKGHYKRRHQVENFFQRIKEKRAVGTRYEKLESQFLALVVLASICDWLHP